jgi:hypothetical protein
VVQKKSERSRSSQQKGGSRNPVDHRLNLGSSRETEENQPDHGGGLDEQGQEHEREEGIRSVWIRVAGGQIIEILH